MGKINNKLTVLFFFFCFSDVNNFKDNNLFARDSAVGMGPQPKLTTENICGLERHQTICIFPFWNSRDYQLSEIRIIVWFPKPVALIYRNSSGFFSPSNIQGSHFSGLTKFHDFSRFFSKFPGIFFIILKWLPYLTESKSTNLKEFVWTNTDLFWNTNLSFARFHTKSFFFSFKKEYIKFGKKQKVKYLLPS